VYVHQFHGTPFKSIEELWKEGSAPEKITAHREALNSFKEKRLKKMEINKRFFDSPRKDAR
jgi:hypothetical protein